MKKFVFLLLFFPSLATAHSWNQSIYDLADRPVLQGTSWAAVAAYEDGTPLFSIKPDLRLAPASTLKLITSAAALETLGPDYQFQTRIYADALPDSQGILHGNIYIQGGADPTLGSSRVVGSLPWQTLLLSWSEKIKAQGIKKINGHIYGDVSLLDGLSLPTKTNWQNMGNYFAAPVSALNFNDNSFKITFLAQPTHGQRMAVKSFFPQTEGLKIRSFVTADKNNSKDNAYVYAAPKQYEMEIHGTLPVSTLKEYSISAALPDPAQLLTDLFIQKLEEDGITVSGSGVLLEEAPSYESFHLLHTHYSPPLKDIIYIVNKRSFNLYAEILLRSLAIHAGKKGSAQAGLEELNKFLQKNGISTQNILIYDGSGLSRDNQITAQILLDVLQLMTRSPYFSVYFQSLATLEDRGDLLLLRRFFTPLKRTKDIHVKGGTIDGVKAQAGYVKDAQGNLISFAFIANNLIEKSENINRFYEDILKMLMQSKKEKAL